MPADKHLRMAFSRSVRLACWRPSVRLQTQEVAAVSVIALAGQTLTHSPHPVQLPVMTTGSAEPITRGEKRMAASLQASPQLRQTTLL